ncbi:MAG: pseudouridine synthase, partial [Clostridia bacterium]
MRLQKYLALCGIASRRKAEELIAGGHVKVDGVIVDTQGMSVDPNNRVEVDGKLVKFEQQKVYIMLNKPAGYVSTVKDQFDRPTVLDLVKGVAERVYPVGRLDYETEGLLLLTNDGELANHLSHPSHNIEKEYIVVVKGPYSQDIGEIFAKGITIDGKQTKPAKIEHVLTENRKTTIRIFL